jgi:hypothetical protein
MLWDMLLGTYLYKKGCDITSIGIDERIPVGFLDQLAAPFRWASVQNGAVSKVEK